MKCLTIQKDDSIGVHSPTQSVRAVLKAVGFRSEAEFARVASRCPLSRLAGIWNSLPGVTPVKKFTDRKTAINRIWKAAEELCESAIAAAAGERHADVPTAQPDHTRKEPSVAKQARMAPPKENALNDSAKPVQGGQAREGTKTSKVLAMLRRDGGATPQELMQATGWQPHSLRGFLSGTVHKKMGIRVVLTKNEAGVQRYTVTQ